MARTVQSYVIAATKASVLPIANAHHAQTSPRRKAVTVTIIAIRENATPYRPYIRKTKVMNPAVAGDVLASADQEFPVKPSYSALRIGAEFGPSKCSGAIAAIAPQASNPTSAIRMRVQATRRHDFIAIFG